MSGMETERNTDFESVRRKMLEVFESFQSITGTRVFVYDILGFLEKKRIFTNAEVSFTRHTCAFCQHIMQQTGGRSQCVVYHHHPSVDVNEQDEKRKFSWKRCHAGLDEIMIPVKIHGYLIAYVFIGEFRLRGKEFSLTDAVRYSDADIKKLREFSMLLPVTDRQTMERAAFLFSMALENVFRDIPQMECRLHFMNAESSLVNQLEQYLRYNLEKGASIKDIASHLYVSPAVLSRTFRKETGVTLNSYINARRYDLAARLLTQKKHSIASVSSNVGFKDTGTFLRWFRRQSNMTVSEFKKRMTTSEISENGEAKKNDYTETVKERIKTDYMKPIRVSVLARDLNVTPDHLARVFRKREGVSISDYLWQVRMDAAKDMLLNTGALIAQIARQTGFSTESAFSERFHKCEGITPSEYRNRGRRR